MPGSGGPDPRPGPVLAIVGPTAAGKSALALDVAGRLGGEIVSADAMTVYRRMDVGTAKPSVQERALVPHHMVDVAEPSEEFSVARFQRLARAATDGILQRARLPVLVGGSGLYFNAVVDDFTFPPTDPAVRARLEGEAARTGAAGMFARLARADPAAAARIHPQNTRRIVRALEVLEITGRRFSAYRSPLEGPVSRYRLVVLGLDPGPPALAERIEHRVRAMAEAGLVEEVRRLAREPLSRTARQALGYKELLGALERGEDPAGALDEVVRRTRGYARRQLAWFRRDPRIRWGSLGPAAELVGWAVGQLAAAAAGEIGSGWSS